MATMGIDRKGPAPSNGTPSGPKNFLQGRKDNRYYNCGQIRHLQENVGLIILNMIRRQGAMSVGSLDILGASTKIPLIRKGHPSSITAIRSPIG